MTGEFKKDSSLSNGNMLPSESFNNTDNDSLNNLSKKIDKANNHINHEVYDLKNEVSDIKNTNKEFKDLVLNLKSYILSMSDDFYSGKEYSTDNNPIKLYTTETIAKQLGFEPRRLREILLEHGNIIPNDHEHNDDTVYRIPNNLIQNGFAVIMPYTDQEKYPGKYYYRWTEYGRRTLFEWLKNNNMLPHPFVTLN